MPYFNLVPKPYAKYNDKTIKEIVVGYDEVLSHYFIELWGSDPDDPLYWQAFGTPRAKMLEMIDEFVHEDSSWCNSYLPYIKKQIALDLPLEN